MDRRPARARDRRFTFRVQKLRSGVGAVSAVLLYSIKCGKPWIYSFLSRLIYRKHDSGSVSRELSRDYESHHEPGELFKLSRLYILVRCGFWSDVYRRCAGVWCPEREWSPIKFHNVFSRYGWYRVYYRSCQHRVSLPRLQCGAVNLCLLLVEWPKSSSFWIQIP